MPMQDKTTGKSATLARQAYAFIRDRILSGEYAEGQRLTEQRVCDTIGLSRTPVREAMRMLVADGFLSFRPNIGTVVRVWGAQEAGEVFDARILVESELAAHAARHIDNAMLGRMEDLHDAIESCGVDISEANLLRISPLNRDFHAIISDAANNPRLAIMRQQALEVQIIRRTRLKYSEQQLARSFHHHREILDALRSRDSDWARAIMACHLRSAKLAFLGSGEADRTVREAD